MLVYGLLNFKDVLNIGERNLFQWEKGKHRGKVYTLILYFKQNSPSGTGEITESFRKDSCSHLRF